MSKRRRHELHEEEPENAERWLLTYADMITLLMVLFIVLFSMSQIDASKYQKLKKSLGGAFGGSTAEVAMDAGNGVLDGGTQPAGDNSGDSDAAFAALAEKQAHDAAAQREAQTLQQAQQQIVGALNAQGLGGGAEFRTESRGLVVTIVTDRVLFDLGSDQLRPEGRQVLDAMAPALAGLPNEVAIEGHTDDQPIRGSTRFATNWELSTARATQVLRYLVDAHGLHADKVSAAGYADQRPRVANDSEAHRSQNRRVEVVVLNGVDGTNGGGI